MKKNLSAFFVLVMLISGISFSALAEDDWITLRVEAYDRSIAGFNVEDCMQLHYIQQNFGDPNKIHIEFVPVSRWDEGTILTTQLAGGTAPDICLTYSGDLVNQYIDMGGIYQLDVLLAEYGSNLVAFLGDELLEYGKVDTDGDGQKEQYIIPARRISVANVGNFIRQDWLDALGMDKPTNVEELTAYLYAAKEANLGGEHTYPVKFNLFESDPLFGTIRFTDAFVDFSQVTEEDWFAYSGLHEFLPGSREGYRWLNQLYNDGILYENFALGDNTTIDTYTIQGYFGYWSEQPDQPWRFDKNIQKEMAQVVEGGKWTTVNAMANIYTGDTLHDVYAANGLNVIIPGWVSEETAVAAVKYLDWMAEYENMFFLQNGVEGVNYLAVNDAGIPIQVQPTDAVPDEYKMHAGDICFIANGLYYGSDEKNAAALALAFEGYEEEVEASYVNAYTDTWTQISYSVPITASIDYGPMVKSKQGEFLVNVISCSPEEFDGVFDEYTQAILDTGAAQIIEEQRAAYLAGYARGSFPYAE